MQKACWKRKGSTGRKRSPLFRARIVPTSRIILCPSANPVRKMASLTGGYK